MDFQAANLGSTLVVIAIILLSLSIHEFAHAFTANLYGDPTAKLEGRLTLNPAAHWDKFGTTLLVGLLFLSGLGMAVPVFGWGKPVPVDENNFDNPRLHGIQTALAGPMSNFIFAAILGVIIKLAHPSGFIEVVLVNAIYINIFLMFFNLIPIPPLDGSRFLRLFLSEQAYYNMASNPLFLIGLILILFTFAGSFLLSATNFTVNLLTHF